jgi:hypothetical protein
MFDPIRTKETRRMKSANIAARLIKQATKSSDDVTPEALSRIKQFGRQSDENIALLAEELWGQLAASNSRVRFLALQVCAELWPRSASFRRALLPQMVPELVQLCGGDARNHPLPPPESWAERLRERACELISSWHACHGHLDGYKSLTLARRYMSAAMAPLAPALAPAGASGSAAPLLAEQRQQRWREKYEELQSAAVSRMAEMRRCAETMTECLRILAPTLDDGIVVLSQLHQPSAVDEGEEEDWEGDEEGLEAGRGPSGLSAATTAWLGGAGGASLDINLSAPEQRSVHDHLPMLEALRDAHAEARNAFEPLLRSWLLTLSRVTLPVPERPAHTALLQRVTALRAQLRELLARAEPLLVGQSRQAAAAAAAAAAADDITGGATVQRPADADDSDEFEDAVDLKPGYEPVFVDPDAGWERPPKEAMRPQLERNPAMTGVPAGDVASGDAAGDVASGDAAAGASPVEYGNNGRAMAGIGTATTGRACGAVRADGSLCKLRVMVGSTGVCPFHGAWVARGEDGRPFAPPEGSVWSRVLACERQALAGSTGAVVGVVAAAGVSTAEDVVAAFRSTTEAPARTIGEDRKRARLESTASGTSTAAHAATSSGAAVCSAPSASAGAPEKRKSKPPPTARERLAAKLAATARATANAVAAHSIKSMEMMHRSHNQGW